LHRSIALRFTLSPELGFRAFRDKEPPGVDRRYTASAIPGGAARLELYPFAVLSPAPEVFGDLGITGHYFHALGITSRDVDSETEVDTDWFRYGIGFRYRILGGKNPLAMGFTGGVERASYEFATVLTDRTVPLAKYTMIPVGVDGRYAWGGFSLFADARFLWPIAVAQPGDRAPTGTKWGVHVATAAAYAVWPFFEVELRATYSLLSYGLPNGLAGSGLRSRVFDEYLVLGLGLSLLL
jgi:hypothetical protein